MSVVAVERISRLVRAAMKPSIVVGEEGTKGGLWCSPVAKTSRPTSSAFSAIATIALIRSRSAGTVPFVGSGVTSPTEKIPNCMSPILPLVLLSFNFELDAGGQYSFPPGPIHPSRLAAPLRGQESRRETTRCALVEAPNGHVPSPPEACRSGRPDRPH